MSTRREGLGLANCQGTQIVGQREARVEVLELGVDFVSSLENHDFCSWDLRALGHTYGTVIDQHTQ